MSPSDRNPAEPCSGQPLVSIEKAAEEKNALAPTQSQTSPDTPSLENKGVLKASVSKPLIPQKRFSGWIWRYSWLLASGVIYFIAVLVLMWVKNDSKPNLAEQLERLNQPTSWNGSLDGRPIYYAQPAMLRIEELKNSGIYTLIRNGETWAVDEARQVKQKLPNQWLKPSGINFVALLDLPTDVDLSHLKPVDHQREENGVVWRYELAQSNCDVRITLDSDNYDLKKIEIWSGPSGQQRTIKHILSVTTNYATFSSDKFQLKGSLTKDGALIK